MRLKHFLSVFLTLLTLSVGQMWGDPTVLFQETFGNNGNSNTVITSASCYTASTSYFTTGHQTSAVSNYSGDSKVGKAGTNPSDNTGASGNSAVWFTGSKNTTQTITLFKVENINISGYTTLKLKFNVKRNDGSTTTNKITVKYKIDSGSEQTLSSYSAPSGTGWTWSDELSLSGTGSSLTITFSHYSTGGYTTRLDDIILTGVSSTPSCSAPTSPNITGTTVYTTGQTISLTASATGTTSGTTYQWYKGDPDNGGTSQGAASTSGATFTKANCVVGDAGTYYCVISNGTGCTAKTSKAITVAAAAVPSITPSVSELDWGTVNKGTSLNTKTFTITGSNLTVANLVYSGNGGYTVSPEGKTGAAGSLASQTITVTPPSTATPGTYNSTVSISGGGLSSAVTVAVKLTVQNTDQFIDELHNTTGYTSANPHIEGGTYSTPTITDKVAAMSGTCEQQHYHFVGWITAAKYEAGTSIAAGDLQTPTSATGATYYAVWAKQGAGGGGTTYTLVTAASQLSTGDKVVLVDGNPTSTCNGVTGWNGNKDATISSTAANWVQYNVTKSNDVWTLKDATANKFIQSPSGNEFIYGDVGGSFEADGDGWVSCNSRYLAINSSMYRFYTYSSISTNSYDVFYMYKVGSSITYTDYIAQCCTELGQINGSFFWTTHFCPVWPEKHRS